MKIYFVYGPERLSSEAFMKTQPDVMKAKFQKLIDEIAATGALKSRANVDANGPNEWRIRVANEKNVLVSAVIGVEKSPDDQNAAEKKLFANAPAKSRWLEILRAPSEVETRYEDREPYTVDTWTKDEFANRLPTGLRDLFLTTIGQLLSGQSPKNSKPLDNGDVEINLGKLLVRAVWKSSSIPRVP